MAPGGLGRDDLIQAVTVWHATCHPALTPHIERALRASPTWFPYLAIAFDSNYVKRRWFDDYDAAYEWATRRHHRPRIVIVIAEAVGDLAAKAAEYEAAAADWDELLEG